MSQKNGEGVRLLLEFGADPNTYDSGMEACRSALLLAMRMKPFDIARILLADGADPRAADGDGKTALDLAREAGQTDLISLMEA